VDGGEIGRAQALQAVAAHIDPHSDLNPVLLKPQSEIGAQVVLQGHVLATVKAEDYTKLKPRLLSAVIDSFERVSADADLVVIEGAGSPAEINLRDGDIANMGFATAVNAPVLLVGDIDRGGVIAQIVGTKVVLSKSDAALVRGFVINKFRGDPKLFETGLSAIVERTGWHAMGVVPWFNAAHNLPAEDIMEIRPTDGGAFKIAVPRLSRIANFDDLDPLSLEPGVSVDIIEPGRPLPANADLVLIPGTKSTIADLAFFRAQGWDVDLAAHIRRNGRVLGICGGYQMLGRKIFDPDGLEGQAQSVDGLGHLDISTEMHPGKHLSNVRAEYLVNGIMLTGYEIHIGETTGPDCDRAWLAIGARRQGAQSADGRVQGCYLHGLFASDGFRRAYLRGFGVTPTGAGYSQQVEQTLDALADHLEKFVDLDLLLQLAE